MTRNILHLRYIYIELEGIYPLLCLLTCCEFVYQIVLKNLTIWNRASDWYERSDLILPPFLLWSHSAEDGRWIRLMQRFKNLMFLALSKNVMFEILDFLLYQTNIIKWGKFIMPLLQLVELFREWLLIDGYSSYERTFIVSVSLGSVLTSCLHCFSDQSKCQLGG